LVAVIEGKVFTCDARTTMRVLPEPGRDASDFTHRHLSKREELRATMRVP
jgi:hypothetical protein